MLGRRFRFRRPPYYNMRIMLWCTTIIYYIIYAVRAAAVLTIYGIRVFKSICNCGHFVYVIRTYYMH